MVLLLAIASSLAPLSLDFFAPALPSATRDLGVPIESVQLTIYIFLIGYGVAPFLWGALADRVGRRKIMIAGLCVYIVGSIGCLFSPSVLELSLMRLVQGIGAASGVVIARAVLRDIHGARGATKAISSMFMVMVWFPITAPLVGGYLASQFDWRIGFAVMALIALVTLYGSVLWLRETLPSDRPERIQLGKVWLTILTNPIFMRHTLTNMFCIGTMVIFLSNYSFLANQYFQLSAMGNGVILAFFNASISAGVFLVRLVVPVFGIEKVIMTGVWLALTGWILLWVMSVMVLPMPVMLLLPMVIACIGIGMVISLTVGQALIPFTHAAGSASALFVFLQSMGASGISYLASSSAGGTLPRISMVLVACALMALISLKAIAPDSRDEWHKSR